MPEETLESHLESQARQVKSPKISHAILTPGADIEHALVKSTIKDDKQLNGLLFFLAKLEDCGLGLNAKPPLNSISIIVLRKLIGSGAIHGKNIFEALEADAGLIDQAFHQLDLTGKPASLEAKPKKGFGFLKKEKAEHDNDSQVR